MKTSHFCAITGALALATAALAGTAASQAVVQTQAPTPTAQTPAVTVTPSMTLAGCLYKEAEIPGRTPNVAERAGVLEDYILADAAIPAAAAAAGASPAPVGTSGAALTSGNMYKVEGIADERLKALVHKKVEITGKVDPEGGPAVTSGGGARRDQSLSPDTINLPEFEATAIREIPGTCPAIPAPLK